MTTPLAMPTSRDSKIVQKKYALNMTGTTKQKRETDHALLYVQEQVNGGNRSNSIEGIVILLSLTTHVLWVSLFTRLDHWIGPLDWTAALDWTAGLDYWTGPLDWTAGLDECYVYILVVTTVYREMGFVVVGQ